MGRTARVNFSVDFLGSLEVCVMCVLDLNLMRNSLFIIKYIFEQSSRRLTRAVVFFCGCHDSSRYLMQVIGSKRLSSIPIWLQLLSFSYRFRSINFDRKWFNDVVKVSLATAKQSGFDFKLISWGIKANLNSVATLKLPFSSNQTDCSQNILRLIIIKRSPRVDINVSLEFSSRD